MASESSEKSSSSPTPPQLGSATADDPRPMWKKIVYATGIVLIVYAVVWSFQALAAEAPTDESVLLDAAPVEEVKEEKESSNFVKRWVQKTVAAQDEAIAERMAELEALEAQYATHMQELEVFEAETLAEIEAAKAETSTERQRITDVSTALQECALTAIKGVKNVSTPAGQ